MNSIMPVSSSQRETNRILELHLGRLLPLTLSSSPGQTLPPFSTATDPADAPPVGSPVALHASLSDLTQGLWDLLGLYVATLEASDHGGWSRVEEEKVIHFLSLLGWTGATVQWAGATA